MPLAISSAPSTPASNPLTVRPARRDRAHRPHRSGFALPTLDPSVPVEFRDKLNIARAVALARALHTLGHLAPLRPADMTPDGIVRGVGNAIRKAVKREFDALQTALAAFELKPNLHITFSPPMHSDTCWKTCDWTQESPYNAHLLMSMDGGAVVHLEERLTALAHRSRRLAQMTQRIIASALELTVGCFDIPTTIDHIRYDQWMGEDDEQGYIDAYYGDDPATPEELANALKEVVTWDDIHATFPHWLLKHEDTAAVMRLEPDETWDHEDVDLLMALRDLHVKTLRYTRFQRLERDSISEWNRHLRIVFAWNERDAITGHIYDAHVNRLMEGSEGTDSAFGFAMTCSRPRSLDVAIAGLKEGMALAADALQILPRVCTFSNSF